MGCIGFGLTRKLGVFLRSPSEISLIRLLPRCCIDKQSSAELSEAINSMYRWYRKSTICYAYLEDVSLAEGETATAAIGHSRWFTRGWTLQELLAPPNVDFYTGEWTKIGTKTSLAPSLQSITGIEGKFLTGSASVHDASISKRMSWASKRNTTRVEDTAYSLLGIFDINMSLLYGEGAKAFERLQHALLREFPHDHTLYAWGTPVERTLPLSALEKAEKVRAETPLRHNETPRLLLGLLAESPRAFAGSASYIPVTWAHETFAPHKGTSASLHCAPAAVVGRTIRLDNPVYGGGTYLRHLAQPNVTQIQYQSCSPLLCTDEKDRSVLLHIFLVAQQIGLYGRTEELVKIRSSLSPITFRQKKLVCDIAPEPSACRSMSHGSIIFRSCSAKIANYLFGSSLEQCAQNTVGQGADTGPSSGNGGWAWPVCKGVLRAHLTVFTLPVDDTPLEGTGIVFMLQTLCRGAQKDYLLVGRQNGLLKTAVVSASAFVGSVFSSPMLCSHVFSDSVRDSAEFPMNEGKRAFVTAERVFFDGEKFIDVLDLRVEEPPENGQAQEGQPHHEQVGESHAKEQTREPQKEEQVDEPPKQEQMEEPPKTEKVEEPSGKEEQVDKEGGQEKTELKEGEGQSRTLEDSVRGLSLDSAGRAGDELE